MEGEGQVNKIADLGLWLFYSSYACKALRKANFFQSKLRHRILESIMRVSCGSNTIFPGFQGTASDNQVKGGGAVTFYRV